MTYLFACECHQEDHDFSMGTAPTDVGPCTRCRALIRRVFTPPAIVYGPGMRPPWADKVQKSSEMQERFGKAR